MTQLISFAGFCACESVKYAALKMKFIDIFARCTVVGERFFMGHTNVAIVDVNWYPNSIGDTHILVLTSDNVLR